MEAAQDGVDFLFGVVDAGREGRDEIVEDHAQLGGLGGKLLDGAILVEVGDQYLAGLCIQVRGGGVALALGVRELSLGQGPHAALVQLVDVFILADNAHEIEKLQVVECVADGHSQFGGHLCGTRGTLGQHADDPKTVGVGHGFDKIEHIRGFVHFSLP